MRRSDEALVILTPAFPASESEGNWVPSQQLLVKRLQEEHPHTQIIVLSFLYPYQDREYDWNGIPVTSFNGRYRRRMKRLFVWMRVWKKLLQLLRSHHIVGLFSFWCGECALIGSWFGRMHGIPHRCWICGQDARRQNGMVRFIRPQPTELAAISDFAAAEFFRSHGIRPAHILYNAIDQQGFPEGSEEERTIDVLAAGSLTSLKRTDIFVRVVLALQARLTNVRAVHCGDGEERKKTARTIRDLDLQTVIELKGEQPHHELLKLMRQTRILLHPSAYEGFSTVCLEALYAGAHVISFCRPVHARIDHWHVVQDEKEMFEKAVSLLLDPALDHSPVLFRDMSATAHAVMNLFHPADQPAAAMLEQSS